MEKHSLSHTGRECVRHIVWIPKYRRKVLYGETGRDRTLWARGYYVSTVGLNEAAVRRYVQRQEDGSRME